MSRVLLLQGPMGPFFSQFGAYLRSHGSCVWKVNFNGGDWFYSRGMDVVNYRGTMEAWPQFLSQMIADQRIDQLFLFGDCRSYHRGAIQVARETGIHIHVFEEGYVRPHYITLEEGGVNGFSSLPRNPHFYLDQHHATPEVDALPSGTSFSRMARAAMLYYLAGACLRPWFWHYEHHKSFSILCKGTKWCRSGVRKLLYARRDANVTQQLANALSKNYFLVPLQVHNDSQIKFHSSYADVEDFIQEVITSFALHAPQDAILVFKHHPMDRGARHYGALIGRLRHQFSLEQSLLYTHEIHLPTALTHARGVIVINSTVGLSALLHNAPVKVMGNAIYDMEGLTSQQPLEAFWSNPGIVSKPLLKAFRRHVIATTQINGSFYGLNPFPVNEEAAPSAAPQSAMRLEDA